MKRLRTLQLLLPKKEYTFHMPQHLVKPLPLPQTMVTFNHSRWPYHLPSVAVHHLPSVLRTRRMVMNPLLLLPRLHLQSWPLMRPLWSTRPNANPQYSQLPVALQSRLLLQSPATALAKMQPLVARSQLRILSVLRDRTWRPYSKGLLLPSRRIQLPSEGVLTSVGLSHLSIPNLRTTLASRFSFVRISLIDFAKPPYGHPSFGHFTGAFTSFGRLITNLHNQLSLKKIITTSLSAMPFTIASVNMNNRSLSEAGQFLEQQEPKVDILCIQEFTRRKEREEIVLDHRSNPNQMSLFNRLYHMRATAAFITNGAGIIVFNNGITVLHSEIQPRLVTVQLSLTDSFRNGGVSGNQLVLTSVYAPVKATERQVFFEKDMKRGIEGIVTLEQPAVLMGDFNDFELVGLDRWPPYRKEMENERNLGRAAARRCWATVLTPILQKHGFHDAFRYLYPEALEYSRIHYDGGEVCSATRIDHVIASENLLDALTDIQYIAVGFSDHKMVTITLAMETEEDDVEEQQLMLQMHQQNDEDGEFVALPGVQRAPLVGPGLWKLYHGALTEQGFCIRSREIAKQLVDSVSF
jgi:exonuclease III